MIGTTLNIDVICVGRVTLTQDQEHGDPTTTDRNQINLKEENVDLNDLNFKSLI